MKKNYKALKSRDDIIVDAAVLVITLFICIVVLYPLLYVLSSSFSDPVEVAAGNVLLFPKGFTLEGYEYILDYKDIWIGYRNTLFYTVVGTLMNLAVTLPAAYALSRRDLFGRGFFTTMFAVTMFFSGGLIPTYLVYKKLNLINTVWVMLIPGLISMWNTVVCRTYFTNSIPYELQEASKINRDGYAWRWHVGQVTPNRRYLSRSKLSRTSKICPHFVFEHTCIYGKDTTGTSPLNDVLGM